MLALTLITLITHFVGTNAYIWPSPQLDALEALRFDLDAHPILQFIKPCDTFAFDPAGNTNLSGRSNTADWIRTAYHDMATHDAAKGTGGMDASIRFPEELARDENVGNGFNNTLSILYGAVNRYVSIADALVLGAIIAIENCGGPQIAFRGGRIDALKPNAPGVPEPQQDLPAHVAAFARQGFTQTEMISLIACGHSFGGVQHAQFPQIVPEMNDTTNTESVAHFDSTRVTFDNNVATEYISGKTQNPLVVGLNDTTNSDKRIFASDGNVTMRSFAQSPTLFATTCGTLFARMFDSVPKGVRLTEVIKPLRVKPENVQLVLSNDTLQLNGEVRLWNTTVDHNRTVLLVWEDHAGHTANATLQPVHATNEGRGASAAWYVFTTPDAPFVAVPAAAGITKMRFVVNGKTEDQGGVGFVINDEVVLSRTSCLTNGDPFALAGRLDVAVRTGTNPARIYLEREVLSPFDPPTVVETNIPRPAPASASSSSASSAASSSHSSSSHSSSHSSSATSSAATTSSATSSSLTNSTGTKHSARSATAAPANGYTIWSLPFANVTELDGFGSSTLGVEMRGGAKRTVLGEIQIFGLPMCE